MIGTNKTQLLYCIRLQKYIPQAPLEEHYVRETEWQREDTLILQDDLYAHIWDTNFGRNPFDIEIEIREQQEDTVDYEPTSQPQINRPPRPQNFEKSGGIPAEQPAVNDKEPQTSEENFSENENYEPIPVILRNPTITLPKIRQNPLKTTQKVMLKT